MPVPPVRDAVWKRILARNTFCCCPFRQRRVRVLSIAHCRASLQTADQPPTARRPPPARDDLVAFGYMLVRLAAGALPWREGESAAATAQKKRAGPGELASGVPDVGLRAAIAQYLTAVTALGFDEMPDYAALRDGFAAVFPRPGPPAVRGEPAVMPAPAAPTPAGEAVASATIASRTWGQAAASMLPQGSTISAAIATLTGGAWGGGGGRRRSSPRQAATAGGVDAAANAQVAVDLTAAVVVPSPDAVGVTAGGGGGGGSGGDGDGIDRPPTAASGDWCRSRTDSAEPAKKRARAQLQAPHPCTDADAGGELDALRSFLLGRTRMLSAKQMDELAGLAAAACDAGVECGGSPLAEVLARHGYDARAAV